MARFIPLLGLGLFSSLIGCGARSGLGVDEPANDASTDSRAFEDATEADSVAVDSFALDAGRETIIADDGSDVAIDSALDAPSVSPDTPDAVSVGPANDFTVVTTPTDVIVGGSFGGERGTQRLSFDGELLDHHAVFPPSSGVIDGGVHVGAARDVLAAVTWEAPLATGVAACSWRALAEDGSGIGPIVDVPVGTCVSLHVRADGFDLITQARRFSAVALTTLDASGAFVATGPELPATDFQSRAIFDDDAFLMGFASFTEPDDIMQRVAYVTAAGKSGDGNIISFHNTTAGSTLAVRLVDVGGGRVVALTLRHEKGYNPTLWTEVLLFDGGILTGTERWLDTDVSLDGLSATRSRGDVVVAWSASKTLKVQRLAPDGESRGGAVVVATSSLGFGHIEVTSTPMGALVLYSSEGELFAVPVTW